MPRSRVPAVAALALVPTFAAAQEVHIDHAAVGCVVAEQYPVLTARFDPADKVSRAAVHFRTAASPQWYSVAMQAEADGYRGILPKPTKGLERFEYYIDVTDRAFAVARTPEQSAQVVADAMGCQGKMMAGTSAASTAAILVQGPAGAPIVPAGFASTGVTSAAATAAVTGAAVGAGAAAAVAGAAAGASTGGGLGAGAIAAIVGGGAAVAGAAVAVASGGGDDGTDGGGAPQPIQYSVIFPQFPGIDVSVCAGRSVTWNGQSIVVFTNNPAFDTTWSPNEPNTLRVTGTATDTAFNANIACVNGAASGTISATGTGGSLQGSFTLGSQRGPVNVRRQ
jgi:hypothetical protein